MSPMMLDEYLAMPWTPTVQLQPSGDYRLTVKGLPDFELFFVSIEEAEAEWRYGLRSHLMAYLGAGKTIPIWTGGVGAATTLNAESHEGQKAVRLGPQLELVA